MTDLQQQVADRRRAIPDLQLPADASRIWGLALSGGGIRSATFCLGLLRALASRSLLLRFDLLSTVSGGGYIGSMLGRLFSRARSAADVQAVARAVADADARWFAWWLRANGRYLVPRGAKDRSFAMALYLRNLVGVHIELGLLAVVGGVLLALIDLGGWWGIDRAAQGWPQTVFPLLRHLPDWMPVVALLLVLVAAAGFVAAAAYWCVPWVARRPDRRPLRMAVVWIGGGCVLVSLAFQPLLLLLIRVPTEAGATMRAVLLCTLLLLALTWMFAVPLASALLDRSRPAPGQPVLADAVRSRLTKWLANCLRSGGLVILVGVIDRLAWWLAFEFKELMQAGALLAVAATLLRTSIPLLLPKLPGATGGLPGGLTLARLLGYALTLLLAAWWVSVVYQAALGAAFQRAPNYVDALQVLAVIGLPAVSYLLLTGRNLEFLNLSSLHPFYRARLVRSYLGAANAQRFGQPGPMGASAPLPAAMPAVPALVPVSDVHADDDLLLTDYRPQQHGGPVHLMTTCVNQTKDPRGGLFNQDRRGLALTVASGGLMQISQRGWTPLQGRGALTLGTWVAISGAAVAPGMGNATRGGLSALATFAGLRLGYWWDRATRDNQDRSASPLLAKSLGLLRETFGVFRGTDHPDWFLTDGGHFENTAAYALLAERAELIVLADCGADPQYRFGDLENLVRKARIDLQAEVLFQRPKQAAAPKAARNDGLHQRYRLAAPPRPPAWPVEMDAFGSLNDLKSPDSQACLALARIVYHGERSGSGLLIVIKPNLAAGLPVDLVNFKAENPEFPQQSTADQFFSEAQWESYFQLGTFLGGKLTKAFVDRLLAEHANWFEADDRSPLELRAAAEETAADGATKATGMARLPARVGATAVNATIGLGAAATLGVSAWQAIDSARTSYAKQTTDERAALKELTELWAKLPPAAAPAASAAPVVGALAAAIVRTADTLCPRGEAGWFRTSSVARTIYDATKSECSRLPGLPACTVLLESATPALQSALPNCLQESDSARRERLPRYGFYDYGADAPFAAAHPCDPAAQARRETDDRYRSQAITLADLRNGHAPSASSPAGCGRGNGSSDVPPSVNITAASMTTAPAPAPSPASTPAPGPSSSTPSASASASASVQPMAADVCRGKTVFIQIYGTQQRDPVRAWREPWQQLGASVPPIDDVYALARASNRGRPTPVSNTIVRYHDEGSKTCALALAPAVGQRDWQVEPLSGRLRATPGTLEVWVAPPPKKATD